MTATIEYRQTPSSTPHDSTPTLRGHVNTFYRIYKGKRLGPYYVRRWKTGRRVFKQYIKPADVARVKAECDAYRREQARRRVAGRREATFVDNFRFLARMMHRFDQGKGVPAAHANWIVRLHRHGCYSEGRPKLRRRVVRRYSVVDGERVIVTTDYELDGTTRVFMVPLVTKNYLESLGNQILAAWNSVAGLEIADPMIT